MDTNMGYGEDARSSRGRDSLKRTTTETRNRHDLAGGSWSSKATRWCPFVDLAVAQLVSRNIITALAILEHDGVIGAHTKLDGVWVVIPGLFSLSIVLLS